MKTIPEHLAKSHGGSEGARTIGLRWAETFELHGGLSRDDAVLDIGCGPGRMALGIGERYGFSNPHYLGFDITEPDIEWCKENISRDHPNFQFMHLDIHNGHYNPDGKIAPTEVRFPGDDEAFDFIFAASVFTHMRTPEMLVYLKEAKRRLRPGGSFLATFICLEKEFEGNMPPESNFNTEVDEHCFTSRPNCPEDAIGYRTDFVLDCYREVGFSTEFYRGGWAKILEPTGRHGTDYIVAS